MDFTIYQTWLVLTQAKHCRDLENLLEKSNTRPIQDEIDLLALLIEKWDNEHNSFGESDPIRLNMI